MARDNVMDAKEEEILKMFDPYPDVVLTHPDLTEEELEKLVKEHLEKCKGIKEWPLI